MGHENGGWMNSDQRDSLRDRPDYTRSIARDGEEQFACILRNRSGIDSGNIDFGMRMFADRLCDAEKQDIADVAYALYESVCRESGKRSKSEKGGA